MIVVVLSPAPEAEENHFGKENDAMQDAQKGRPARPQQAKGRSVLYFVR
jgi:hypothetical protein